MRSRVLGDNEETASTFYQLGVIHYRIGDFKRALDCLREASRLNKELVGDHTNTAACFHTLGAVYLAMDDSNSAVEELQKAAIMRSNFLGADKNTACSYHLLGVAQLGTKDLNGASESLRKASVMNKELLGDHSATAASFHLLGEVYLAMAENKSALEAFQKATDMRLKVLDDHKETANSYHKLGVAQFLTEDLNGALESLKNASRLRKEFVGDHTDTAESFHVLGCVYLKKRDKKAAVEALQEAADMRSRVLGYHKTTAKSYHNLGVVQHDMGDLNGALESLQKASRLRQKLFGENHPDTLGSLQLLNRVKNRALPHVKTKVENVGSDVENDMAKVEEVGLDVKELKQAEQEGYSRELENTVTATMKFEAEHEECLRVLPYKQEDRVVVHLYVFSGKSGIPESLKAAAQKCFEGMEVTLKWLDLYNDADKVLNVTSIVYPSGEPKVLKASQVEEISEIINKHLYVFDEHRNITAVQASFKITESKQTEKPCIAIYVLGKGYVPIGETEFPCNVGPYPVDVVNGFWYRARDPWEPNKAQEQSEVLCLGASVGVNGEEASGTLGAIVEDQNSGTFYALSCDHVIKHPGLDESLKHAKDHLNEYNKVIEAITEPGCLEDSISIESLEILAEKINELKSIKEKRSDNERCTKDTLEKLEKHDEAIQTILKMTEILHPGLNDHLNYLQYHLKQYGYWIDRITKPGFLETNIKFEELQDLKMLARKFGELKAIKEKCSDSVRCSKRILKNIEEHERAFETCSSRSPRVIGNYIAGVSRNVKWTDGKEYFVDAALAKLTLDEVERLRESRITEMIGTGVYPSGECSSATTMAILSAEELCKSGRTTGYTTGRLVVNAPSFLKPPAFRKREDGLVDTGKHSYFCQKCAEARPTRPQMIEIEQQRSCEACREAPAVLYAEGWWLKNCLCIASTRNPFVDKGDSGAVIFEKSDDNQSACLSGFGLIFAAHENAYKTYAIASPLEVVLKVLSQEILKEKPLIVVSKYSA